MSVLNEPWFKAFKLASARGDFLRNASDDHVERAFKAGFEFDRTTYSADAKAPFDSEAAIKGRRTELERLTRLVGHLEKRLVDEQAINDQTLDRLIENNERLTAEVTRLANPTAEMHPADDPYVKEVGAWKIIQRLEEERDSYRYALTKIAECKYDDIGTWLCTLARNALAQYDETGEK